MFEVQVGFLVSPLARAGSILPVRFVADSLPEEDGFELAVPPGRERL